MMLYVSDYVEVRHLKRGDYEIYVVNAELS